MLTYYQKNYFDKELNEYRSKAVELFKSAGLEDTRLYYFDPSEELTEDDITRMDLLLNSDDEELYIVAWDLLVVKNLDAATIEEIETLDINPKIIKLIKDKYDAYANRFCDSGVNYFYANINKPIETERLVLDVPNAYDEDTLKEYLDNKEEFELFTHKEYEMNKHTLSAYINGFFYPLTFAIRLKGEEKMIGYVELHPRLKDQIHNFGVQELTYYIAPQYRRNGYAKEALQAFVKAYGEGKLIEPTGEIREFIKSSRPVKPVMIVVLTPASNVGSNTLLKHLGFEFHGTIKAEDFFNEDTFIDNNYYSLDFRK